MPESEAAVERLLPYLNRVIRSMSEAVLVLDRSASVVAANEAAVELLDLSDRSAALRPLDEYDRLITSWSLGEESFAPARLGEALEGHAIPRQTATLTTAAGVEHIVQFTATPIEDEQGRVVLAMLVASDITLQERARGYWEAVGTAARGLSAELNIGRVLNSVMDQIVASLGGGVVLGLWRWDEAEQRLVLLAYRGISKKTAERLHALPPDCPSFVCEAYRERQTRYTEDARRAPPEHELDRSLVEAEGLVSWVGTPLLAAGDLLGALGYGLRGPRRFYHEDLQAVETVSGLFGVALQHAELFEEVQSRVQELEREQQDRGTFLTAVAHDLRTPLTAIKGYNQLLGRADAPTPERRRQVARTIDEQVGRLQRMIDDLLDASRMAAGQFGIREAEVDLVALARGILEARQPSTPQHRLRLEAPGRVVGQWDAERLAQVLENVVGNAVKFSPEGGEVVVRIEPRDKDVRVSVTDRGVGMAPEEARSIFQPFQRLGAAGRFAGVGLGLYIARSIVEAHGGRIEAESERGRGATITFSLPYEPPRGGRAGGTEAERLSPRQREVARLVARGWSNERIARELLIGPGTVANHVQHILERLRLENRTQIATWAQAHLEGSSQ